MKILFQVLTIILFLSLFSSVSQAQWNIDFGDTTYKIPVQIFELATGDEFTTPASLNCRRSKNGVDGACAGTSAEQSEANHPGLWHYTPGAGDVDTAGSLVLRFTATDAKAFRSVSQVGPIPANITRVNGSVVPNLYDGLLASDAGGATLTIESGDVATTGQFDNGFAIVFYTSGGAQKAKACILTSTAPATIVTVSNIASLIANNDPYNIKETSACLATLQATQAFNNTGTWTGSLTGSVGSVTGAVGSVTGAVGSVAGNVTGSVGSVAGNVVGSCGSVAGAVSGSVNGSVLGSCGSVAGNVSGNVNGTINGLTVTAIKDFFDTNSSVVYATAVSGSVVKEIADNAAGGGGGGGACSNLGDVWDEARNGHTAAGTFGETYGSNHVGVAQAIPAVNKIQLAAAEDYRDDDLKDHSAIKIVSATAGMGQVRRVCGNVRTTDTVTLCKPWKTTPTGTIVYEVIDAPKE